MANSIPQLYFDCTSTGYPFDLATPPILVAGFSSTGGNAVYGDPMCNQECLMPLSRNCLVDHCVSESDITTSVRLSPFHGQLVRTTTSDLVDSPPFFDTKSDFYGGMAARVESLGAEYQPNIYCELGEEECCGVFGDDYSRHDVYPALVQNSWGIQGNQHDAIQESNMKVGRYSEEERKERILRYLKKKLHRNFNKTIKYTCRKTLADRRVRIRGRFARNKERCEEEGRTRPKKDGDLQGALCCSEAIREKKTDEDDWLQEAIESLMYFPYISS